MNYKEVGCNLVCGRCLVQLMPSPLARRSVLSQHLVLRLKFGIFVKLIFGVLAKVSQKCQTTAPLLAAGSSGVFAVKLRKGINIIWGSFSIFFLIKISAPLAWLPCKNGAGLQVFRSSPKRRGNCSLFIKGGQQSNDFKPGEQHFVLRESRWPAQVFSPLF